MRKRFVLRLRGRKPVKRMPTPDQVSVNYAELVDLINRKGRVRLHERVSHLRFDREGISYAVEPLSRSE